LQVGDGNVQHNVFSAPRREVQWPHRVGVVPPLADCRQLRQADHELDTVTMAGGTVLVCQVLSGLGGVGKTQLAAGLAHRVWDRHDVDLLVWVPATSRDSVVTSYAQAAADIAGIDDPDPEHAAGRLLAWLAEPHARRWMIVLDDLRDPADLNGLWPPSTGSGRVVVTTRRRDSALTGYGRHRMDVGLFTPEEASRYLRDKVHGDLRRLAEADLLAADLGHLPLALAQAAAYLIDRGLDCAGYRRRLADRRRRLTDLVPEPGALPDEHRNTVAATWSLSIDRADQLNPAGLARPVLELAGLLDSNAIPIALFTTPATLGYLTTRRGQPADADETIDALHCLHRLSLIGRDEATATIRVHGLVQRAVREATPEQNAVVVAEAAADALAEIWRGMEREPAIGQILRANTAALHAHTGPLLWTTGGSGGHPVLFTAGHSLGDSGLVTAAADYFRDLHAAAEQYLGPDHRDTLATRGGQARWRGEAGDPAGATTATEQLLIDYLRAFGPDDRDTLATRGNLAHWRGEAGDPIGAAEAFEQLLSDELRVFGPDDPSTLTTRNNLACWRGLAGDPIGAAEAFEQMLADYLRVLGPDHPKTLATRNNLARSQGEAGDPAGAADGFEALLTDYLRVLGPDHPDTLTTRNNLADWRGGAGDPAGAVDAFEALLTDRLRVLGPDHPNTMATCGNLASWRGLAGDPAGAVDAFEALLTDRLRVLGPDHRDTLATRNNLAYWRGRAGNVDGEQE
jgi:hypothetical protein